MTEIRPEYQGLRERARHTPEQIAEALGNPAPTPEQSAVISADMTPLLVVAGAGSGKTATMVDRVVWLVVNGFVQPEEVLGVTFTAKAAGELRQRMTARLQKLADAGLYRAPSDLDPSDLEPGEFTADGPAPVPDPMVSTYHAFAKSLVSEYGLRIGVEKDVAQLGQAQSYQLMAQIVAHWDGPLPENPPAASTLVAAGLKLSGECAEHLRTPEEVVRECEDWIERLNALRYDVEKPLKKHTKVREDAIAQLENKILVARLAARYQRVKEAMQVLDFGDLLAYAATIARGVPAVGQEQRDLYRVVLLDEFQDTSHAQMVLFASLFGHGHSVMAVGDPKQSIYGFRGASEGQLFDFYGWFPAPEERPAYLSVAWRNSRSVLTAANALAAPLAVPPEGQDRPASFGVPDLQARPGAPEGAVKYGIWNTSEEEAAGIVAQIDAGRRRARAVGTEPPSAAVLCRTRSVMEEIRLECERQGLPYELLGLGGLLDTPEVVDLVATLRVLADPGRSDALVRLLAGARWRIGPADLMALNDWARFLASRRRRALRTGIEEDLATPDGALPEDPEHPGRSRDQDPRAVEQALDALGADPSENSSLIEGLETLPADGWTSSAGRSLSPVARDRLERFAAELTELRGYLGEDLGTLVHHIERVTLLDIELAAFPDRDIHQARANLESFHQTVADYCATAPRMAASLDASAAVGLDAESPTVQGTEHLSIPQIREHRYTVTSSAVGVTAFLTWLEAATAEENGLKLPVEQGNPKAVQLLTLHGSKGLEWDEVYLAGLVEGTFPTRNRDQWLSTLGALPWSQRGDSAHLPVLRADAADLLDFVQDHASFQERNAERVIAEERRLAYVGLTRARDLLMLSTRWWSGSNKKPGALSIFLQALVEASEQGMLTLERVHAQHPPEDGAQNPSGEKVYAALWPFDPLARPVVGEWGSAEALDAPGTEDVLAGAPEESRRPALERAASRVLAHLEERCRGEDFGGGDQNPEVGVRSSADPHGWAEETELLLALREKRRQEAAGIVLPTHVSASLLVGLAQDAEAVARNLARPMPRKPVTQARSGTQFHEWVEGHYGSTGMLDLEDLLEDEEDGEDAELEKLKNAFRNSPWYERQPWAVEFPLETPLGGYTLRGRIDAVFRTPATDDEPERWELVDWKTGRVPRGEELEHKAIQLAAYRLGFARLRGVDPKQVSACFYYVGQNRTVRPKNLATEEELEALLRRLEP